MTENQQIASIILQQLGGRRFVAMTGAKCLVAIDNGLRFRIGRNGSKANMVNIVLRGDDTYTMTFLYVRNPHDVPVCEKPAQPILSAGKIHWQGHGSCDCSTENQATVRPRQDGADA